jgi:hypothetical protein
VVTQSPPHHAGVKAGSNKRGGGAVQPITHGFATARCRRLSVLLLHSFTISKKRGPRVQPLRRLNNQLLSNYCGSKTDFSNTVLRLLYPCSRRDKVRVEVEVSFSTLQLGAQFDEFQAHP